MKTYIAAFQRYLDIERQASPHTLLFFFSSRRRHTSCGRAWSSDVCSSDLVALGRHEEFKLHLRAAIEHGVPKDDVKEVLLQAAIYCGVPAANTAFHLAEE